MTFQEYETLFKDHSLTAHPGSDRGDATAFPEPYKTLHRQLMVLVESLFERTDHHKQRPITQSMLDSFDLPMSKPTPPEVYRALKKRVSDSVDDIIAIEYISNEIIVKIDAVLVEIAVEKWMLGGLQDELPDEPEQGYKRLVGQQIEFCGRWAAEFKRGRRILALLSQIDGESSA